MIKSLTFFLLYYSESYIEELKKYRDIITFNDEMKVNLEMYSESIRQGKTSSVRQPIDEQLSTKDMLNEFKGMQGSFRKLEID